MHLELEGLGKVRRLCHAGQQYTQERAIRPSNCCYVREAASGIQQGWGLTYNDGGLPRQLADLFDESNDGSLPMRLPWQPASGDVAPSAMMRSPQWKAMQEASKISFQPWRERIQAQRENDEDDRRQLKRLCSCFSD